MFAFSQRKRLAISDPMVSIQSGITQFKGFGNVPEGREGQGTGRRSWSGWDAGLGLVRARGPSPPSWWREARQMHDVAVSSPSSTNASVQRFPFQDLYSLSSSVPINSRTSVETMLRGTRIQMHEMRVRMQHKFPRPQWQQSSLNHVGQIGLNAATDLNRHHHLTIDSALGCRIYSEYSFVTCANVVPPADILKLDDAFGQLSNSYREVLGWTRLKGLWHDSLYFMWDEFYCQLCYTRLVQPQPNNSRSDEDRQSMSTFVSSKFGPRISWGLALSHKVHRSLTFFSRYIRDDTTRNQFILQVVNKVNDKCTLSPILSVSTASHPQAGLSFTQQLSQSDLLRMNSIQIKAFCSGSGAYSFSIKAQAGRVD